MGKKKQQLPAYDSVIGGNTQIVGDIRFVGALHVDGKVMGDVTGQSLDECALTLGESGTIEGNVDVAHVMLDGTVKGDVRATARAELDPGACIEGKLYYGILEVPSGAKINGELLRIDESQTKGEEQVGDEKDPADDKADPNARIT